jgi:hypothetical protein
VQLHGEDRGGGEEPALPMMDTRSFSPLLPMSRSSKVSMSFFIFLLVLMINRTRKEYEKNQGNTGIAFFMFSWWVMESVIVGGKSIGNVSNWKTRREKKKRNNKMLHVILL